MMDRADRLAILGAGNIGRAMALGLVDAGRYRAEEITLTRRRVETLDDLKESGFRTQSDNAEAVKSAGTVLVAVEPQQLDGILREIDPSLRAKQHVLVSVVSGASIAAIGKQVRKSIPIVRAMPNTAVALRRSMTCIAAAPDDERGRDRAVSLFDPVGRTIVIEEELMVPATALCACGIAFFLRAVRSASQGGIEIGFHPREALTMAAQTALGAASLVLESGHHPEREIDTVTTPRGCTIAGLNQMEHQGFSSAMIKGIVTSAEKASSLYEQRPK